MGNSRKHFEVAILLPLLASCGSDAANAECQTCSVQFREISEIVAGAGALMSSRIVGDSTGGVFVFPTVVPGEVAHVDAHGALDRHFGRAGDGPGEFRRPDALTSLPGGGVLIATENRLELFDSSFQSQASLIGPARVTELVPLSDSVVVAHAPSVRAWAPTLFLISIATQEWRSFGGDSSGDRFAGAREIAVRNDTIWTMGRFNYRLESYDQDTRKLSSLRVEHPWFVHKDGEEPAAQVVDALFDQQGRLWVLSVQQRGSWTPPRQPTGSEGRPVRLSAEQWMERWQQRLDILDVRTGSLLVTQSLDDQAFLGLARERVLYGYRQTDSDLEAVLWEGRIEGPVNSP